jgi:hypothetical protein
MKDLSFVAGEFLHGEVPSNQEFLKHYFTTELESVFLSHHLIFGNMYAEKGFFNFYLMFRDHTGHICSTRWLRKLLKRFRDINEALDKAYKKPDLSMISLIKAGAFFNPRRFQS